MPTPSTPKKSAQPHPRPGPMNIDAPADEPLALTSRLTLETPFRLDRGLIKRLRRREVNATEAFTIRDSTGAYFRASLKEYDERSGLALPYERMDRSPEPAIDITLA